MQNTDTALPLKQIALFLLISFGFAWAIWAIMFANGGFEGAGPFAGVYLMVAMFGPAIGAVVCALKFDRPRFWSATGLSAKPLSQIFKWLPYAFIMPVLLVMAGIAAVLLWQGIGPANPADQMLKLLGDAAQDMPMSAETLVWIQIGAIPVGMVVNAIILTFSEELGWRGWLQPKLSPLGFWPLSLVIGVVWGLWHAPIILMGYNYPGLGWGGVLAMTAFTTLLTPYLSLLRERGAGAWGAGVFHGALNATAGLMALLLPDPTWPLNGLLGPAGFVVMLLGWPLIEMYRRRTPIEVPA